MSSLTRAVVVAGVMAAACGSVRADAQIFEPLKFQTTFPFTVDRMTFPAGKYEVRPLESIPDVLQISNGSMTKLIPVEPAGLPAKDLKIKDDGVTFRKLGDQYVLTEIWDGAAQAGVEPIPSANQNNAMATHQRHHHHTA